MIVCKKADVLYTPPYHAVEYIEHQLVTLMNYRLEMTSATYWSMTPIKS